MLKMYAFIQEGKVQNIVPCHSQEDADELIKLQYTENPIAIKIEGYDLTIGDRYENGEFFHYDYIKDSWVKLINNSPEEEIKKLKAELENLKKNNGSLIKNQNRRINYDTCLFEEYFDFRIEEAVFKYQNFLENAFILHTVTNEENTVQHQINMSHNNWYSFMNMYLSYKALTNAGLEAELYWFDGEANKIIFKTEDECLSLMKTWREQNQRLSNRLNDIIKQIYSCKKKSEIKAIDISFE